MRMPPRHTPNSLRRCSSPMAKKKFNTTALQNELEQSAFFTPRQAPEESHAEPKSAPAQPAMSSKAIQSDTSTRTIERPVERTTEVPNERTKVRHSFDVYADQLLTLRQMAFACEQATGKRVFIG